MVIVVVLVEGACVDARLLREIFPQVRTEIIIKWAEERAKNRHK